jgi:phenylacetate-CoA ligase
MTLIGKVRSLRYRDGIDQRAQDYSTSLSEPSRLSIQLDLWNTEWRRLRTHVPYFRSLAEERRLPIEFTCWQQFIQNVPIMTRAEIQKNKNKMISTEKPPELVRMTGGSTAEPIQIPAWHSEYQFCGYDIWLARSWYEVLPDSRLFLLWGHSHLLGTGVRGWINSHKRMLFDRLLGYCRFSAYDLQPSSMQKAARELISFKPNYVIGYSVALDLFARANFNLREEFQTIGLKVVVGAAEGFPSPSSISLLNHLFGCHVGMEYGSVETTLIAHTHPKGGYYVFWRSYFIEAEHESNASSGLKVRVTSLYPRCFPLVRYEIGDEIELGDLYTKSAIGIEAFQRVVGRCNDYVILEDGVIIHSELFTHVVRSNTEISNYQIIQNGKKIFVNYLSRDRLSNEKISEIKMLLVKIHSGLACVEIKRVESLQQTIAGKTPMVIRE